MRRGELKEYRADFFSSVGLIYAFTPSLAYKHPWNQEPVLLSLLYSPVGTTLGKSAWQQHLRAAVGLSRRWFSRWEVSPGGCLVPCPLSRGLGRRQQQPGERCALLWAQGWAHIRALQSKTLCKDSRTPRSVSHCIELHSVHLPWLALLKKNQAPFPSVETWVERRKYWFCWGKFLFTSYFLSSSLHLGNARPPPHPMNVVFTGVSGHWVS